MQLCVLILNFTSTLLQRYIMMMKTVQNVHFRLEHSENPRMWHVKSLSMWDQSFPPISYNPFIEKEDVNNMHGTHFGYFWFWNPSRPTLSHLNSSKTSIRLMLNLEHLNCSTLYCISIVYFDQLLILHALVYIMKKFDDFWNSKPVLFVSILSHSGIIALNPSVDYLLKRIISKSKSFVTSDFRHWWIEFKQDRFKKYIESRACENDTW